MIFKCTLNLLLDTSNKKLQTLTKVRIYPFRHLHVAFNLPKLTILKIILYMYNLSKFDLVTSKQNNLIRMKSMHILQKW